MPNDHYRVSPAAARWLARIDAEGGLVVDTANGCIRNLREVLFIKYASKNDGVSRRFATVTELGKSWLASNVHEENR